MRNARKRGGQTPQPWTLYDSFFYKKGSFRTLSTFLWISILEFMALVFDYMDYREYLKDACKEIKSIRPFFSYRYIGTKINVDPSYLAKVFQKQNHLNPDSLEALIPLLPCSGKEEEYLRELVHFTKAKNNLDVEKHYQNLQRIKGISTHTTTTDQFEFYMSWKPSAVRAILGTISFKKNYGKLGQYISPPLSAKETKEAVALLMRLQMIEKDEAGYLRPCNKHLSSGSGLGKAIMQYHNDMLEKARESLNTHPHTQRNFTALTAAVDKDCWEDINEIIAECRRNIQLRVDEVEIADRIVQLNFQNFPLSQIPLPETLPSSQKIKLGEDKGEKATKGRKK